MELVSHGEGATNIPWDGRNLTFEHPVHGVWSHDQTLLVLLEEAAGRVLHIYRSDTMAHEHRVEAPAGWSFYFLIGWHDQPAIVATSDTEIHGRYDFHWLIDVHTGALTRHVPFV